MNSTQKLFSFAVGCFVLGACQAKQDAIGTKPVKDVASSAPAGVPVAKPTSTTPATLAAPTKKDPKQCRVLLNLSDGSVADVRFGETTQVETAKGFVLQDGDSLYSLDLISISKKDSNRYGSLTRQWQKLVATPLPGGKPKIWLDGDPGITLPDENSGMDFDEQQGYEILGNLGPLLMISDFSGGFTGGAHEYDGGGYKAMRYPKTEDQGLQFLAPEALHDLQARIAEIQKERGEDEGGDSSLEAPKDLKKDVALSFGVKDGALSLTLHVNLFCCTWVENHNQLEVEAPLTKIPAGLKDQLSAAKEPFFTSPDGCSIGLSKGKLVGRVDQKEAAPIEGISAELRGVSWISLESPFSVKQLEGAHNAAQSVK